MVPRQPINAPSPRYLSFPMRQSSDETSLDLSFSLRGCYERRTRGIQMTRRHGACDREPKGRLLYRGSSMRRLTSSSQLIAAHSGTWPAIALMATWGDIRPPRYIMLRGKGRISLVQSDIATHILTTTLPPQSLTDFPTLEHRESSLPWHNQIFKRSV